MAAMDKFYATDCIFYDSGGRVIRGLREPKKLMGELYDVFPDYHETIDDVVVEGDKIAVRHTFTGTHKGEYRGVHPTNKIVKIWVIEIDRVAGGKVVEGWARTDTLGFMQQLGVVPTPEKK